MPACTDAAPACSDSMVTSARPTNPHHPPRGGPGDRPARIGIGSMNGAAAERRSGTTGET